jgi:phosphoenolpyruvate-protein kinase (PTS system EI component)
LAGIEVALWGELALLGLGLEELSVSAQLIPRLKRAISFCSFAEAERIAQQALHMSTSAAVRGPLADAHRRADYPRRSPGTNLCLVAYRFMR